MISVNNVIIHKLIKERHGDPSVELGDKLLKITSQVEKLVGSIHDLYAGRTNKGYGRFSSDETTFPTSAILRRMYTVKGTGSVKAKKATDFVKESKLLMAGLKSRVKGEPLATGGFVLMADITNEAGTHWIIIAIITNVNGNAIDESTLDVVSSVHVDLEDLRVAGRVNLTDWLSGASKGNYVGFLKQKGDVAEYFKTFLGVEDMVSPPKETKHLVKALRRFAADESLDPAQENDFLLRAHDYCIEQSKNHEVISLEALSNAAWPDEPKKLQKTFAMEGVQISDGFIPDGPSLKRLVNMSHKTDYWKIDMNRVALQNGYAKFNKEKKELTLMKLPSNLLSDLMHENEETNSKDG